MTSLALVCFHHAGGGSASFHPLHRSLAKMGADLAFTAVTLPGRESRREEPRYVDAARCVRDLADELDDLLTGPHVLLGHSMGALLAHRLAQLRIAHGRRAPEAVVVAGCRAPHLPPPLHDLHTAGDRELAAKLVSYGGLPADILQRPDWLALLMPTVRDDLRIVESSHRLPDGPALPCPLHIFGGVDDPLAPPDMLAGWSAYSVQPQPVRLYPGGHFLFRSPEPALVSAIARVAKDAAREGSLVR